MRGMRTALACVAFLLALLFFVAAAEPVLYIASLPPGNPWGWAALIAALCFAAGFALTCVGAVVLGDRNKLPSA